MKKKEDVLNGRGFLKSIRAGTLLALCILSGCGWDSELLPLIQEKPYQRPLAFPNAHTYRLIGNAGEYAELVLTQMGADLKVIVLGPDRTVFYEVDGEYNRHGTEYLCFPLAENRSYLVRIEVASEQESGAYRLEFHRLTAGPEAEARAAAFALVDKASKAEGTEASVLLLNQAAEEWQAIGDDEQAAMAFWRQAEDLKRRYRFSEAVRCYERAIALLEGVHKPELAAIVRYYLAVVFQKQGNFPGALDHYQTALAERRLSDRDRAPMLRALGKFHTETGFFDEAEISLTQAMELYDRLKNNKGMVSIYGGLGWMKDRLGKYDQALALYEKGLKLGDGRFPDEESKIYQYRAKTWNALGNPRKALESLLEEAARKGMTTPQLEVNIADCLLQLQNFSEARARIRKVLPFFEGIAADRPYVLYKLAMAERGLGNTEEALSLMEQTLSLTRELGRKGMNRSERMEFLANRHEENAFMLDLLVEDSPSPAPMAFSLAASARLRLFHPVFSETCDSPGDNPELRQHIRELADKISAIAWRKESGESGLTQHLNVLLHRYNGALEKLCPQPVYHGSSDFPGELFESAQDLVDEETTLLFFAMGRQSTYLWVFSHSGVDLFQLASPQTIDGLARDYHDAFEGRPDPDRDALVAQRATMLRDALFSKAWPALKGKRLAVVPDGGLHYVPIQALPLPEELGQGLFASRFQIVILPSLQYAEALNRRARTVQGEGILVVADPLFGGDFARLVGSHHEAETILELGKSAGIETKALFGAEANRDKLLDMDFLCKARYLHFSTHGLFYEDQPELSALVLSTLDESGRVCNGFVRIQDIARLELNARLVVLSACRTALGKELRGAGLVGFADAFSQAGGQGVLVSLWRVDDFATAELMQRFYRELFHNRVSPAEALRRAQVGMAADPHWKNPYYWAGFIYQGAW